MLQSDTQSLAEHDIGVADWHGCPCALLFSEINKIEGQILELTKNRS